MSQVKNIELKTDKLTPTDNMCNGHNKTQIANMQCIFLFIFRYLYGIIV